MQAGKMFKKLDAVMAYRISAITPQPSGSYSVVLESITGPQPYEIRSDVVLAAQAPPEVDDYLVFPDHVRGYAHYLVERAVFDRNYQVVPKEKP